MRSFGFRAVARRLPPPSPPAGNGRQNGGVGSQAHPLYEVLITLRGRTVSLLVDGRELSGRLISTHPIILIGSQGQATLVQIGQIKSVAF